MSKLDSFIPQRRNANKHTQRGMGELERSVQTDGWIGAITAAADGEIFDGSARREVVETALNTEPIIVESDGTRPIIIQRTDIPTATDPRAIRLGLAANKIAADNLSWSAEVLKELQDQDAALLAGLFRDDEFDALLATLDQPIVPGAGGDEFDTTPDEGPTRTNLGELWQLGRHRLLIADCTDPENVARLMDGKRADMIFTDPPYNHASENKGVAASVSKIHNDLMMSEWDKNFEFLSVANSLDQIKSENCTVYVCVSWHTAGDVWAWMKARSSHYSYCVWMKPNPMPSLMKRHWTWASELICYATYGKHTFHFPSSGHALNVWEINKVSDGSHPTQKPVELVIHAIKHSSNQGDIIGDLFLGSGTTLIAAERTGRTCYGCEISPMYADVILRRFTAETGIEPTLISRTGEASGESQDDGALGTLGN